MGLDAKQCRLHRRLHLRRTALSEETHVGGKIGRADEDAVDAVGGGDSVESGEPRPTFDLQQQADLVIGRQQVAGMRLNLEAQASAAPTPRTPCGR